MQTAAIILVPDEYAATSTSCFKRVGGGGGSGGGKRARFVNGGRIQFAPSTLKWQLLEITLAYGTFAPSKSMSTWQVSTFTGV